MARVAAYRNPGTSSTTLGFAMPHVVLALPRKAASRPRLCAQVARRLTCASCHVVAGMWPRLVVL